MIDEVIGELTKTPDGDPLDGYTATVESSQGLIQLTILLYDTPLDETLPLARSFVSDMESYLSVARNCLLADFLPMHNTGYLEDGEEAVSERDFLRKAGIPVASIDLDGEMTFTYRSEVLLWGHWMDVCIHPDGSVDTGISG